ncbi:hypothetical protein [Ensifer sp. MJa1]|uniref:hypothetical protein n=1 Tax=Ensifer sp. MJa1 TaxID=2919888 RepID=UPI00300B3070
MIRELGLFLVASPHSRFWQMRHLRELDAERLVDLGITREEARHGRRADVDAAKGGQWRKDPIGPGFHSASRAGLPLGSRA